MRERKTFRCWEAEENDEEGADEVQASDTDSAAYQYARTLWERSEELDPEEYGPILMIRCPDGSLRRYKARYWPTVLHYVNEVFDPPIPEPSEADEA